MSVLPGFNSVGIVLELRDERSPVRIRGGDGLGCDVLQRKPLRRTGCAMLSGFCVGMPVIVMMASGVGGAKPRVITVCEAGGRAGEWGPLSELRSCARGTVLEAEREFGDGHDGTRERRYVRDTR